MSRRHWVYSTKSAAEAVVEAIDIADGGTFPRKGVSDTGGRHGQIPDTYVEGAFGWIEHVVPVLERDHAGPPEFVVPRAPEMTRYEGTVVATRNHGQVTIPTNATAVDRPGGWRPKGRANAVKQRPKR